MTSVTDPTVILAIGQTLVITLTLVVFIFQFRSQEKAIRESAYQNLLGRYHEYILSSDSADSRMLSRLFQARSGSSTKPSDEDVAVYRRLMIAYGIIEEAYGLYNRGWIEEATWEQWDAWLRALAQNPSFSMLHTATAGMFDKEFQGHVSEVLDSMKPQK